MMMFILGFILWAIGVIVTYLLVLYLMPMDHDWYTDEYCILNKDGENLAYLLLLFCIVVWPIILALIPVMYFGVWLHNFASKFSFKYINPIWWMRKVEAFRIARMR